ncbi:zinc finger protein 358-like isoform X4 [Ixodes scapularis]
MQASKGHSAVLQWLLHLVRPWPPLGHLSLLSKMVSCCTISSYFFLCSSNSAFHSSPKLPYLSLNLGSLFLLSSQLSRHAPYLTFPFPGHLHHIRFGPLIHISDLRLELNPLLPLYPYLPLRLLNRIRPFPSYSPKTKFYLLATPTDSSWTWHQNARGSIYTCRGKGCHSWPLSQNGQPITVGACGALRQGCVRASLQASPLGGCGEKTAPTTPGFITQYRFAEAIILAIQARHENKMLYVCPTCGRQFRQNTGLWRHLRTHNPDAPRPRHPCAICGREFSRPDNLRAHSATHDHPHERSFVCQVCNRGFLQGSDLKRHRLVHSAECRFRCAVCERTFSDRSSRNRHQREHDPMQCYVCTMCGTTFKRTSKLRGHVTRMHGDSTVSELRPGTSSTERATDGTAVVPSGPEAVTTESEKVSGVCASAIFDLSCGVAVLLDEMDNGLREVCKPSVSEERQPELETRGTSLLLRGEVSNGHPASLETTGEIRA